MANLVFKFSWDHRPFQYNSAQGKRQFMLPFASGIPNLTPDWTQVQGLRDAATKAVGEQVGNVMQVGAFGWGVSSPMVTASSSEANDKKVNCMFATPSEWAGSVSPGAVGSNQGICINLAALSGNYCIQLWNPIQSYNPQIRIKNNNVWDTWSKIYCSRNTTVDANGFIKAASPIVKLFSDHIELNEEADKQPIEFEKVDVGEYLLKGSLGFALEGWYIEVPKDANGNTIVAVVYDTLENGDISIKTCKRKFDFELAAVVADLDNPIEIPEARWIDIRLHEEPESESEELMSETPVDFQLTNLSEAVSAAMIGIAPPELSEETK
ncbi:phage tail protein [Acinetobacter pittii]|uniref:phage tail fiber protein n=1 Tax=Acinetobacter pittii TaxID=48296 RepID=UPI00197E7077|nr:phage tail protein [Acinetobacter pittii]MBN6492787.1 phage tail protein [Acinetobacter pittii]